MSKILIEKILAFAQGKNPYIVRHGTDDLKAENPVFDPEKKGYQDFIEHRLYKPVEHEYLEAMKKKYPQLPGILWEFYQKSNGATFFANPTLEQEELGGFYFLPMENWTGPEQEWLKSWVSMDDEDYEAVLDSDEDDSNENSLELYGMPPWFDDILVLGGFEASPERFYIPTTGEFAGKTFMFEHDEHRNHSVAESFEEFLKLLIHHPADLIYLCGGNYYYDMVGYGDENTYDPISERYYGRVVYEYLDEELDDEDS